MEGATLFFNAEKNEKNTVKRKYILLNRTDDVLGFSEIIPDDTGTMSIKGLPTAATRRLNTDSHVFIPEPTASNPRKPVAVCSTRIGIFTHPPFSTDRCL